MAADKREDRRERPEPGLESKRSERFEGWSERDVPSSRGSEWGQRDVDRAEAYGGGYAPDPGAPPGRSEGPEQAEYGGEAERPPPGPREETGRAYEEPDEDFERRERPGYQAAERKSGLGLRHPEFIRGPAVDDGAGRGRAARVDARVDAELRDKVRARLDHAPDVDARGVQVRVLSSEVTLRGTVASHAQRRRAEDLVMAVRGVREVHNRLHLDNGEARP